MTRRPRILMLTRLFPSRALPAFGTFCLERAIALSRLADVRVMVPTPWVPAGLSVPDSWRQWAGVERSGIVGENIAAAYPRYLAIPKVGTALQGLAMAYSVKRELARSFAGWRPDVIDGHFAFPDGYAAVQLARHLGCPALVTCHGSDLRLYPDLPVAGALLRWTLRHADRVVSVSTDLRRKSIELGCPETRALMLSNGVDPGKFALLDKAECRRRLGLPIERRIGVCVGSLIEVKNQSLLIRSLDEMRRRQHPLPYLVLVGDGSDRNCLEAEVAALGLEEHVLFAGTRPHAEVAVWMAAADWLLLSSKHEGWPTVYFEAMACGRPVLTSNVAAAKDAVTGTDYGMIVENSTASGFATAIAEAASREFDAGTIRAYAEQHSWARWAEQTMTIIGQVMASSPGEAGALTS